MTILPGWLRRPSILAAETPKGPWGGDGGGNDGPRNPWSLPPGGRKGPVKPTALDDFLRRARGTGGGGGNGGGGFGGLPSGANARSIWAIGVGIIVAVWVVYTSFHQIGPQQRGIVTYFGRYSETLDPGVRMTLPAPIARVATVNVGEIRTENFPTGDGENLTLTSDQNIIDLAYSVRWNIIDPRDYVFQLADPRDTVRQAAESAMRAVVATTTLQQAIGAGRTTIEQRVADATQKILDSYKSGVRIQGVAIKQAAAPARIVDDFNAVTVAQQEAVANVNRSRAYAQQIVARAQGEAAAFDKVYEQYKLAPAVTRRRMYYETMEAVLAKTDKTIVEPSGVVPYLPMNGAKALPDAAPAASAAPATPAAQTGAPQ